MVLDAEMMAALREVDEIAPNAPAVSPAPPQQDDRGWWRSMVDEYDALTGRFKLKPALGGHIVTEEWLVLNRYDLPNALRRLDGEDLTRDSVETVKALVASDRFAR